jgi:tRNA nucleotidyltransferase (CCA-adding enzyme)
MKIYLVGGAVRDALLQIPIKDKDFLVVGATANEMASLGYHQVGKDFPVFLHPKTQQEYALARIERKTGIGYDGFSCDASATVTLEEDLLRRDLTINALAQDEQGNIYDPYGGQADLNNKLLRHVSDAFIEDPLRVLRVARFAARLHSLGFTIAKETLALMSNISQGGELDALTPERVWQECDKALNTDNPQVFFQVLRDCGALKALFPEIDNLFGIPQPEKWHPEIDTGIHTLLTLKQAALLSDDISVRFAALVHDLGKALSPKEHLPKHHGHGQKGLGLIKQLCQRLRVPNDCKELALLVSDLHQNIHNAFALKASTVNSLFDKGDFWRKPQRLEKLLQVCKADLRGRTGFENNPYPQADYLLACFELAKGIPVSDILAAGYQGVQIKTQLTQARVLALEEYKKANLQE